MKLVLVLLAVAVAGCGARASTRIYQAEPAHNNRICMIPGPAPAGVQHKVMGTITTYMHHYGDTESVLLEMAEEARRMGANAVVGVSSGQRFGWFAWRVVRPLAEGTAVRLQNPEELNCQGAGGTLR